MGKAAVSAVFVLAVTACGGGTSVNVVADENGTTANSTSPFVEADRGDGTDGQVPEALAAVAETDAPSGEAASPVGIGSPPSPDNAEGVHAVLSNGQYFLRGSVPSEEIAQLVVVAAEEVFGPGNVINEYAIDPEVEFDPAGSQSIFLANSVMFASNSAEIGEDFVDVLSFIPVLLTVQPNVTIWAFGHTDSVGDSDTNLELSQTRVDAARDFVIDLGGDPERIFANGEGEENPIADNDTVDGRAQNRRVEFVIQGFDIGQ